MFGLVLKDVSVVPSLRHVICSEYKMAVHIACKDALVFQWSAF